MQGLGKNCASSMNDASAQKLSKAAEDSESEDENDELLSEKKFEEQIKQFNMRLNIDYKSLVES